MDYNHEKNHMNHRISTRIDFNFLCFCLVHFAVEQIKGSEEVKEKILAASQEARLSSDYPVELRPNYFSNSICDKYLSNYHTNSLHSIGKCHLHATEAKPFYGRLWIIRFDWCQGRAGCGKSRMIIKRTNTNTNVGTYL